MLIKVKRGTSFCHVKLPYQFHPMQDNLLFSFSLKKCHKNPFRPQNIFRLLQVVRKHLIYKESVQYLCIHSKGIKLYFDKASSLTGSPMGAPQTLERSASPLLPIQPKILTLNHILPAYQRHPSQLALRAHSNTRISTSEKNPHQLASRRPFKLSLSSLIRQSLLIQSGLPKAQPSISSFRDLDTQIIHLTRNINPPL